MSEIPTTCGLHVGSTVAFPCSLPKGHEGPCYAVEVSGSKQRRDRWFRNQQATPAAQPEPVLSGLDQFQGPAQTTAQRYTDGASPVPGAEPVDLKAKFNALTSTPIEDVDPGEIAEVGEQAGYAPTTIVIDEYTDFEAKADQAESSIDRIVDRTQKAADRISQVVDRVDGSVPTKQREGDQRLPTKNDSPLIHGLVADDLMERLEVGISRYGQGLQALNGRNTVQDAYEEALDLSVYLRTLLESRKASHARLVKAVAKVLENSGLQPIVANALAEAVLEAIDDALVVPDAAE